MAEEVTTTVGGPLAPGDSRRVLLIWDAPNIDMGLGSILGGRPSPAHRPRFDAIGRWLVHRAEELSEDFDGEIEPEAAVFTNIATGTADLVRPWVDALRNMGFAVFAKPKLNEYTDVDPDMLEHIELRREQGALDAVVVASADGRNFQSLLEELAEEMPVTVIGFEEHAAWATSHESIEFVDLEDIPGVFREPLPRISLENLPAEGAWLQPFRPLSALLDQ
ncbi:NYN domain-containing protein [Corynebacterium sp. 320]|uniref:NYN domain-containing protein n=1 Tax=Corynebacterium TaxID=1716 RepID=UPI00125CA58E|nr:MULTISPECIES: NYN domain-containing protein [Corynebacterium]KAB1503192.1 NYN domain-containing protein [Corynebacterium sp. 320]KAB1550595.1 NYN domain-containing protein [Corynebacterium sp. 321]KAB1550956.1 NYN domain-containing protein [Corynebacterium sp. 319]KAB3526989.1 NYN domain-containing protein [Corynebacterium sp. 250]KAB3538481.1 NYN domain-containing protein [Corynebacterium sp. 366]